MNRVIEYAVAVCWTIVLSLIYMAAIVAIVIVLGRAIDNP